MPIQNVFDDRRNTLVTLLLLRNDGRLLFVEDNTRLEKAAILYPHTKRKVVIKGFVAVLACHHGPKETKVCATRRCDDESTSVRPRRSFQQSQGLK